MFCLKCLFYRFRWKRSISTWHDVATWTSGVEVRSMLAVPVRLGGGRVCGVLSAINPPGRDAFSEADLEALTWKAYLVGLVLGEALRTQPAPWATQE